jgi:hypothetical protein
MHAGCSLHRHRLLPVRQQVVSSFPHSLRFRCVGIRRAIATDVAAPAQEDETEKAKKPTRKCESRVFQERRL